MTILAAESDKVEKSTKIDVKDSTYRILVTKAEERGLSLRKYINDVLYLLVKKADFIKKYCPDIYLDTIGSNSLYLKDHRTSANNPKTAEILIKDNQVYCSLDEKNDCIHIHFAYCLPEIALLLKEDNNIFQEQEQEQEEEEEQKKNHHLNNNNNKYIKKMTFNMITA